MKAGYPPIDIWFAGKNHAARQKRSSLWYAGKLIRCNFKVRFYSDKKIGEMVLMGLVDESVNLDKKQQCHVLPGNYLKPFLQPGLTYCHTEQVCNQDEQTLS